jgi:DNA modification methylase
MSQNIFCQLILENCLKHMATMADNSVDLILTDPPYNISGFGQVLKFDDRKDFKGMISDEWDIDFDPRHLRRDFERILAPKGNIVAFTSSNLIGDYYDAFNDDFTTNVAVWHKNNPPPKVRKTSFLSAIDFIMFHWRRGEPHTFNFTTQNDMHNVFSGPLCQGKERLKDEQGNTLHPTQKPIYLMKKIIELTSLPGQVVFDPYGGTMSSGHAALELGRSFIGIEMNEVYFNAAEKRLRAVKKQPGLF